MKQIIQPLAFMCIVLFHVFTYAQDTTYSKSHLISDTRELVGLIESVHPDPYINAGGKIEFHRKFQSALQAIPDSGMTLSNFAWLLQPLVNSVGDGHTSLRIPFFNYDPEALFGIPFWFSVFSEKGLYISRVAGKEFESLIGSKLISVEGLPVAELLKRTRQLMPSQNDYDALWNLNGMLWEIYFLNRLLPNKVNKNSLYLEVELVDGSRKKVDLDLTQKREYPLIRKQTSALDLPSTEACDFAYQFLNDDKKTAFLRIDSQEHFREIVECAIYLGYDKNDIKQFANPMYERYNNNTAPADFDSLLAGIPSVTEVFKNLVIEMKNAETENLIIDLSRNNGGQSIISQILVYFLYGENQLIESSITSFTIDKFSDYYFEVFEHKNLDEINKKQLREHSYKLTGNDFDFNSEQDRNLKLSGIISLDSIKNELSEEFKPFTTFYNEYLSSQYDGYYTPQNVIVTCSERTYSAGFGTLVELVKCGATVFGIPSGQSANCFGNAIYYELTNTGLSGFISTNYIEMFPGDSEKGIELIPHYPVTYDVLKSYDFDPNTLYLYTIDHLNK